MSRQEFWGWVAVILGALAITLGLAVLIGDDGDGRHCVMYSQQTPGLCQIWSEEDS